MYLILSAPISIQIELNESCNNNCVHCYNHWRTNKNYKNLSKQDIDKIIYELIKNKIFDVTITGGEPLLFLEELYYLISLLKKNNIQFSLNTNLRLFTRSIAKKLKSYRQKGCYKIASF